MAETKDFPWESLVLVNPLKFQFPKKWGGNKEKKKGCAEIGGGNRFGRQEPSRTLTLIMGKTQEGRLSDARGEKKKSRYFREGGGGPIERAYYLERLTEVFWKERGKESKEKDDEEGSVKPGKETGVPKDQKAAIK